MGHVSERSTLSSPRSPNQLLLALDVGNTHVTVGVFQKDKLLRTWRLRSDAHATADELGLQLAGLLKIAARQTDQVQGVIIASVVPAMDGPLEQACLTYLHLKPLLVGPGVKLGITNRYKNPEEVGADRLVNAVAVHHRFKQAAIVIDFGTATTIDCVSRKGDYLGGAICPGLELAAELLSTRTAKLPKVTFQTAPRRALGQTTKESLQNGLFWGYIGLVEGLLHRLTKEMASKPVVIATGGLSSLLGPHIKSCSHIAPDLTLEGLRLIWEKNQ